jgi:hypothetical protein
MVTLVTTGQNGKPITLSVPAIFVKDRAHHQEWEEIERAIRIGVDLFMVVVSIATLAGSPGALLFLVSIVDLGLASTDLAIQVFKKQILAMEGGKEFLETWDKVFAVGGLVTGAIFLPNLIQSGFRLLSRVASNARLQLLGMLYHTLRQSKNLLRYLKNPFEIIADYRYLFMGNLKRVMDSLAAEGVYLLREERIRYGSDGRYTYHLGFRDVVFRSGSLAEVKAGIREIWAEGKDYKDTRGLKGYLEEVAKHLRFVYSHGQRGDTPLSFAQKEDILQYAKKYGVEDSCINFADDMNTGYKLFFGVHDVLTIGTDVMPGINSTSANGKLSWKSAVAHELEGHRAGELAGKTHENTLYEEVQASMRASLHGKELTVEERELLRQDAIERLENHSPNVELEQILHELWLEKY